MDSAFSSTTSRACGGFVTLADLQKPAAALWVFGLILSLENAASMLFPSLMDRRWLPELKAEERERVGKWIKTHRTNGRYISDVDCLYFRQKIDLTGKALERTGLMPLEEGEWASLTAALGELRNDLAHGRSLGTSVGSLADVVALVRRAEWLTEQLWLLVDDRDDVWDRYARTECLVELRGAAARPAAEIRDELPDRFWMISAQNPREQVLSDVENDRRHRALVDDVVRHGWLVCEGVGRAPGEGDRWTERMVLATGIDRAQACEISARYGQRSVFEFEQDTMRVISVDGREVRRERGLRVG